MFSNDRNIAKKYVEELELENVSFIWEMGDFTDFDELFLMKSCHNHIISDSTFSRWAGFLDDGNGMVIAPAGENDNTIYPQEWKTIKINK